MRIGHGYDVHRLVKGRMLVVGGVKIEYDMGLEGHSDADVLIHSVCDALLGAAGLGDIGKHFPDSDGRYLNIDSRLLLRETVGFLKTRGYSLINLDCTVIAQAPKLSPYIDEMKINLADDCGVSPEFVNVKATTEEGLGFTGRGEGIASHAVCIIG